jgi:hypothetical protein
MIMGFGWQPKPHDHEVMALACRAQAGNTLAYVK